MNEYGEPFEIYMSAGVQANNAGRHDEALQARFAAFATAENAVDAGRAARDIGHNLAALGDDGEQFETGEAVNATLAEAYADHALWTHNVARDSGRPGAEREYRASAGYVGVMALHRAIDSEKNGTYDAYAASEAKHWLGEATAGPADDQYTINFIGRYAMALGLYEPGALARDFAKQAWRLGKMSEREGLPHSAPNLSNKERRMAQAKALVRAAGACAVGELASLSALPDAETKRPKLRKLALTISERLI